MHNGGFLRKEAPNTPEVPSIAFRLGDIMRDVGPASSNSIEMVLEAVKKNEWQNYVGGWFHTKSEAIRY